MFQYLNIFFIENRSVYFIEKLDDTDHFFINIQWKAGHGLDGNPHLFTDPLIPPGIFGHIVGDNRFPGFCNMTGNSHTRR